MTERSSKTTKYCTVRRVKQDFVFGKGDERDSIIQNACCMVGKSLVMMDIWIV